MVSHELGQLKGSFMKAGQMLSMYGEYFLPPEANQILKTLQSNSPPVAWSEIEPLYRQELGAKFEDLEINPEPIGSASLGQVHKALHKKTNTWLALKIQYPGIKTAIDSDLKAIRSFLSVMKLLPSQIRTEQLFEEVRTMLHQEVDYKLEADNTERFKELLKDDPRYIVPSVYREFCTGKLIATSYEEGDRMDAPSVQGLSKAKRNHLGVAFLELYFRELFQWGLVQTDPHLGNYRIRLGKNPADMPQTILFDFGAVRSFDDSFRKPYFRMIASALGNDRKSIRKYATELAFVDVNDSDTLKTLFENFCLGTVEPFLSSRDPHHNPQFLNLTEEYDWQASDLPQRLSKMVIQVLGEFQLRAPPREIIFLDRKTGGVFVVLKILGCCFAGGDLLRKYLKDESPR